MTSIRTTRTFRAPPSLEFMFLHFIKMSCLDKESSWFSSNSSRWTAKSCNVSFLNFSASLASSVSVSGCWEQTWKYVGSEGGKI